VNVEPVESVETLAAARQPYLIGIRHHSPLLASIVPPLLDEVAPDLLLLELPAELEEWLPWLAAHDLVAPVALAAARRDGRGLVFYPYADFSPELAAVRWAARHGVPIRAFDLPLGLSPEDTPRSRTRLAPSAPAPLTDVLLRAANAEDADELWDRTVEARAPGAAAEAIRRAALAVGWSLRFERATWSAVPASDLQREAWMRQQLRAATAAGAQRPAAVVGAFHASALLEPLAEDEPKWSRPADVVTSLVPYAFELLDSRTGYPAGIRDPEWQQAVWQGNGEPEAVLRAAGEAAVAICRELRKQGHPAGVPDAREVIRVATDLARLRDLPAPGRRELVEALQTALAQAEPYGRGRAVAAAMQAVLIGTRQGQLAAGTPRSGLGPHVEQLLAELRLPGPGEPHPREVRLDPLRSDLDRRRHIAIQRLRTCQVPYATPVSVEENQLTQRWVLRWSPRTSAALELSSYRGVTLAQAAEGTLRTRLSRAEVAGRLSTRLELETLRMAAECSLGELVLESLDRLNRTLPQQATLIELVEALELCDRLGRGHVPGIQPSTTLSEQLTLRVLPTLISAAVAATEGLAGSDNLEDARALLALAQRIGAGGDLRLRFALESLERDGSPLMQGAAGAVRVLLGHLPPDAFGTRMGSWVEAASLSHQSVLARRLAGALAMAAPLLEAAPSITDELIERVSGMVDGAFLQRLPALREGFDVMSPAARRRFLQALRPGLSAGFDPRLDHPATTLGRWAAADLHARGILLSEMPEALSNGQRAEQ
jgi:hypothetical protein